MPADAPRFDGSVRAFERLCVPEAISGCWLWTRSLNEHGYGKCGARRLAHRVSWELYRGPIPDGQRVLHRCDTPACVNPDHLFLGSQADNVSDMCRKGRVQRVSRPGRKNFNAHLSDAQALEIIRRRRAGESVRALAREFGTSLRNAYGIGCDRWVHLRGLQ